MRITKKTWHRITTTLLLPLLLTAGWALIATFVHVTILRAVFSIIFLSLVPGYFAFRTLVGYRDKELGFHTLSYSLGLSLIILMLAGLGLNQIALQFNVARPLTTVNLAATIAGVTAGLILTSALRKRPPTPKLSLRARIPLLEAMPTVWPAVVLPVIAVGGAVTLNNGGSNWLAMIGLGGVGLYFLVLAWKNKHAPKWYAAALYGICLTILLGTSMRGWNITGHDVMQEFQVFQLTLQHAAWHMSYYQDAYNACLSITILPTIFQKLTGISDPYIYKFVYQLFFATIAPIMYVSLRKYTSKKIAFLSVFLFLAFPTFLTDMTMLNRQDIALLCLALSLQAGLDTQLRTWHKYSLVFIFLVGMILSHYSTSYIALGTLGIGMLLTIAVWLMRLPLRRLKKTKTKTKPHMNFAIYHPLVIAGALATLFCWNTLATHTSNNIAKTIKDTLQSAPQIIHRGSAKSVIPLANQGSQLSQYIAHAEELRTLPASAYYPQATVKSYPVTPKEPTTSPEQPALRALHIPASIPALVYNGTRQVYALMIEVLIFVGLAVIIIKKRRLRLPPAQFTFLGVASLALIVLQVVLPSNAINYGILRVIQQSLILLALPIILASLWLLQLVRIPKNWQPRVLATTLVLFFLILSGFIPTLTGGFKPVLALNNSGFYYEAYYTHQNEITADRWLLTNSPKGSRVIADEFARRKMITYTDTTIFAQPLLIPATIPIDSYVYLSNGNTTFNEIPVYYKGNLLFTNVPTAFLNDSKNLLYNSNTVTIYK